jgi:tetraprenyl-beta-curcumene synthase
MAQRGVASAAGVDLTRAKAPAPPARLSPRWAAARVAGFKSTFAFASVAVRYLTTVFPLVARELAYWRVRADQIPDPKLRRLALDALRKRGNMEGAALFAAFAPRAHRAETTRALVTFQAAYNHLDILAEQPSDDPVGNGRRLHQALLAALDPSAQHGADQAHRDNGGDGGYLADMLDSCRASLAALPSYPAVAHAARTAAVRIVDFQSLNLSERQGSDEGLEQWARDQTRAGSGLRWWETAAAGGSSLGVHVLIGLAAEPAIEPAQMLAVDGAYFPWIGALHSLLDSLVDVAEDRSEGQRNLLGYYASPRDAAVHLRWLAERARAQARKLGHNHRHEVVLAAMASYYLSAPQAAAPQAHAIARSVVDASTPLLTCTLPLFRVARRVSSLARPSR